MSLASTIGLSSRHDPLLPTGKSRSRYARPAADAETKLARGISIMASRMRRSVTSAVRTCPSTMCRRAVAKSVIAFLDLKKAVGKSGPCAAISRKTQVSPCDCHVIVGGLWLLYRHGQPDALISQVWPRGGVVTQRTANPRTPVQFRAWPPTFAPSALRLASHPDSAKVARRSLGEAGRFAKQAGFVIAPLPFPGSSVVEQPAVNRLVAGSNPARGANKFKSLCSADRRCFIVGVRQGCRIRW